MSEPLARWTALERLLTTPGPSGFEDAVGAVWREIAGDFADDVRSDSLGNSFATVNPGGSPRIAVVGHVDEIGLIVTKIDDKGFIRCGSIGGWDVAVLVGQRALVLADDGPIPAAIGRAAIHQIPQDQRSKLPQLSQLWLDIGSADGEEARARVRVGTPVVLDAQPAWWNEHRLVSRCLDDRVGAFIALEAARGAVGAEAEVVAIGSIGEEIGGFGARAAAFGVEPDVAIIVDVTAATDVPSGGEHTVELGKGPVINRGATTSARVAEAMIEVAEDAGIPYQLRGLGRRTATDGDSVAPSGRGVAVAVLSVPGRYLHTACEQADARDVGDTIRLIDAFVRSRT